LPKGFSPRSVGGLKSDAKGLFSTAGSEETGRKVMMQKHEKAYKHSPNKTMELENKLLATRIRCNPQERFDFEISSIPTLLV
jgi:hypothetical protein